MTTSLPLAAAARRCFRVLIFLLPLHTVYLHAWISWKPWLVLLGIVAVLEVWGTRAWAWDRRVTLAVVVFLAAVFASWPGPGTPATFWRLGLALVGGGVLLLVTGRRAQDLDDVLRVVFWSGAAMAATGLVFGLATNGVFGAEMVTAINSVPGIDRVNKPAYVQGFVALTNWHQDPGYSALWTNTWFTLAGYAWLSGSVRGPRWLGPVVLGGLASATVLTLSRTGWLGLVVAAVALLWVSRPAWRRALKVLAGTAAVCVLILSAMFVSDPDGVGNDMDNSVWFRLVNLVVLGQIEVDEGEVIPGLDPGDNRLDVWAVYWERFVDSPVLGTGLGAGWAEEHTQEPHSLWLQLLGETGLVGLAGFVALLGAVIVIAGRPGRVVSSALAVVGLASFTQTILFEPVLWFVLGLWLAQAGGGHRSMASEFGDVGEAQANSDR